MAFNLGDKFEIHSLRLDMVGLANQLGKLATNIPKEYISSFKSWKHPADNALPFPLEAILSAYSFDEKNAETSQTAHVVLLESVVDRLVAIMQFFGVVTENVLRNRGELEDVNSDLAKKTCAGLIAKRIERLLENALSARETRVRTMEERFHKHGEQTDIEEIKMRNTCIDCRNHDEKIQKFSSMIKNIFSGDSLQLISSECSQEDSEKYFSEISATCDKFGKTKRAIVKLTSKSEELTVKNDEFRTEMESLNQKMSFLSEAVAVEQANCSAICRESEEQVLKIPEVEVRNEDLKKMLMNKGVEGNEIRRKMLEKQLEADQLREKIAESEKELDLLDIEAEKTAEKLEKQQELLAQQSEAAKYRLSEFDGFDDNWTTLLDKLIATARDFREKWQEAEATLDEQQTTIENKTAEIVAIEEENQRLMDLLKTKQQEKIVLENHYGDRKQNLPLENKQDQSFLPSASGDNVPNNSFLPIEVSKSWNPDMNADFKALFIDFLELPDVQNMPEWDLVSEAPAKAYLPDFGISDEELKSRRVEQEEMKSSRPYSPARKHSTTSLSKPKITAASGSCSRMVALPKSNQKLILPKSHVMEASWVISKPNLRTNKGKKTSSSG